MPPNGRSPHSGSHSALELYRNGKTASPATLVPPKGSESRFHPDDTTPIPRPSRYYGRRQDPVARDLAARTPVHSDPSIVPAPPDATPGRIDKSVLAIPEPKRLRDKAHLKFVAAHPCLVCGRQPSDPHHLRFAQPRAIGMKVSDEFTVPLCRGHHRQLHQVSNEVAWWENLKISPLPVAKGLWEESHGRSVRQRIRNIQQMPKRQRSKPNGVRKTDRG